MKRLVEKWQRLANQQLMSSNYCAARRREEQLLGFLCRVFSPSDGSVLVNVQEVIHEGDRMAPS